MNKPQSNRFDTTRLGALVDSAAIGVLIADLDENIYYANPSALALLDYSRDQLIAAGMGKIIHPAHLAEMRQTRDASLKDRLENSYIRESRYVTRTGAEIWVQANVARIEGEEVEGRALFSIYLTSIDRQKRAERELSKTQKRFEFALASAQQGVWDYDLATGESYHSDDWHFIRGLQPGENDRVELDEWLEFIHPDDRDRVRNYIEKQNSGELERIGFEFRERHVDGHWVWILSRGQVAERNEAGIPIRVIGTDTDVTALKQSEEQTARMARRLELAQAISKTGIWEVELETGNTFWDADVRKIFGIGGAAGQVSNTQWEEMVHPDDRERSVQDIERALSTRADHYSQYRVIRPDGEVRHVRSRAIFHDDGTAAPRIIGVNWDVTGDVELTEELRQANQLAARRNEELVTANAVVEHNALHDSLTGLPNRRYLDERLIERASHRNAHGGQLCLLHFDLDRFKQINDTLGHAAGDYMLMHTAEVLQSATRDDDFVARVGGDEFVILLESDAQITRLEALARQVLEVMSQPISYQGQSCRSSVSIGIACASGPNIDPQLLLMNADVALYRAKNTGRNGFVYFTDSLQAEITAAKTCADEILWGLDNEAFIAHYQPQFDAQSLEIVGVEALARWQHPDRGLLPPAAFLKTAEDINVVADIDLLILEQALAERSSWIDAGLFVPRVSVNVSTKRLRQDDLVTRLREKKIEPGVLSFELLESIFLDDEDDEFISWQIGQLHDLGIGIDIDDFGTGHASIVGLLRTKPHRLKIARELVGPIVESDQQRDLVRSIIEIGHSVGVEVVAEGVETMAHADLLAAMGCDILQGYAFGRPMSSADFFNFAHARGWKAVS